MSNYTNFLNGVTIRGIPITQLFPGKIIWVNNSSVPGVDGGTGADANNGTYARPYSTLSKAISVATANRGDVICVMPGHAEAISSATALSLSTAGVCVLGLGMGSLRPTFTLDTATTATINVTAANVAVSNCIFSANFASVVAVFTTTAANHFTVENCLFKAAGSSKEFVYLVDTDTTSNDTDGLHLANNTWIDVSANTLSAIKMDGTNKNIVSKNNTIIVGGPGTGGGILMRIASGKVVTQAQILDNLTVCATGDAGTNGFLITTDGSTNSGIINGNRTQHTDTTSELVVTASSGFSFGLNYSSGVVGSSGYVLPAVDS